MRLIIKKIKTYKSKKTILNMAFKQYNLLFIYFINNFDINIVT